MKVYRWFCFTFLYTFFYLMVDEFPIQLIQIFAEIPLFEGRSILALTVLAISLRNPYLEKCFTNGNYLALKLWCSSMYVFIIWRVISCSK